MATQTDSDERLKKLFVGGLKRDTSDDTLRGYFEPYGELSDCVVIRDANKASRGFGYVTFSNKDSVIDVLNDKRDKGPHSIDGKEVEVKRAIPRDDQSSTAHLKTKKLFIGGLADEATAEDIKQCLANEIRGNFPVSVDLIMKKNEDGSTSTKHRGFCFVEFDNEDTVDELCCIKKVNIAGKEVEVKKAEPKDKDKGGQGGRGGRGGGGRGGYSGRGRGGGGGGGGGGGDYQYGYSGGYQQYGGYGDASYGYGYDPYGNGSYGGYGGGMGMAYQQGASSYGPQGGYGQGGGGGRGGGRYKPY